MKLLQLSTWFSSFDISRIDAAVKELHKSSRSIRAEYYSAKMPLSTSLSRPNSARKSSKSNANYVLVKMGKKPILEFFGGRVQAAGRIYDENLTASQYSRIINILGKHKIFTFKSFKQKNPNIRHIITGTGFFLVMFGTLLAIPAFRYGYGWAQFVAVVGALFGSGMLFAYIK